MPQINEVSWFWNMIFLYLCFFSMILFMWSMKLDNNFTIDKKIKMFYYSFLI